MHINRETRKANITINMTARTSIFDSIEDKDSDIARISSSTNKKSSSSSSAARLRNKKKRAQSTPENPNPDSHLDPRVDSTHGHLAAVFDDWTDQEFRATIQSEPLKSRLYRKLAVVAGLMRPLDERDYQNGLNKEFHGNYEEFDAKFWSNKTEKINTGYQLHSSQLPFDAHQLFKEATITFLMVLMLLYFVILSLLFAAWGLACDCFLEDNIGFAAYIPHGFLLLSGVGDQILSEDNNSTACLWMNSFAILIGVYFSLPVFGAVVLVRLLENRADIIKTSDTVLLTKRSGQPVLHFRAVAANGRFHSNFSCNLQAMILEYDDDAEENFFRLVNLESVGLDYLGYAPNLIKHVCGDDSPLIKHGVIVVDDKHGLPKWNRQKLLAMTLTCNADGARTHCKQYQPNATLMIEPDEKGRLPSFENCTPVNVFHWKKYRGKVSGINDMSKLSSYKYSSKEFRKNETNQED